MTAPKGTAAPAKRIQRKRTKGWKIPPNTVYVGRPSKWGNPWKVGDFSTSSQRHLRTIEQVLDLYRDYLYHGNGTLIEQVGELKGTNLACWCPLNQPCHADVLLELANAAQRPEA